ncbi:jg16870 [Pararge aegeria aegeria]|uniref:Jg16870 protein n=2 Tax=Pararge aegeria aegeria TaxID=348720 RepID=A0A8S4SLV9_9NEOP|nr:jg16870 [Pararge aegeria aegeria]
MVSLLDGDLSLPSVINLMLGSEEGWSTVASFCEAVMGLKEASEREREQAADALPLRRRRTGGRRRRYAHLMPPP